MALNLNLTLDTDTVQTTENDYLSGDNFLLETGLYTLTIKQMYPVKNKDGSHSMQLVLEDETSGKRFSPMIYFLNKDGKSSTIAQFGINKGKKVPILGFSRLEQICQYAANMSLEEAGQTAKIKSVTKPFGTDTISVDMFMAVIGKKINMLIEKQRVNKKEENLSTGKWEPINDERVVNEIAKILDADKFTEAERGKVTEPMFVNTWLEKNQGKIIDRYKAIPGLPGAKTGPTKSSTTAVATPAEIDDIFAY
jgi:hypothetical protein